MLGGVGGGFEVDGEGLWGWGFGWERSGNEGREEGEQRRKEPFLLRYRGCLDSIGEVLNGGVGGG